MTATEAAPDSKPTPSGRLLALVRALIAFGRQAAHSLSRNYPTLSANDIALILRRIARGLMRAEALEARIIRGAPWLDAEPGPRRAPSQRKPPSAPTPRPANMTDLLLNALPTAEEIAAEVRRRPIGDVIADICRDIGLMPCEKLWRAVRNAIMFHGGSTVRLVSDGVCRAFRHHPAVAWPHDPLPADVPEPASAGPPG